MDARLWWMIRAAQAAEAAAWDVHFAPYLPSVLDRSIVFDLCMACGAARIGAPA
jgi:hypothetical protein